MLTVLLSCLLLWIGPGGDEAAELGCDSARILWTPTIKLKISDFKGRHGKREHTAEANTGIATQSRAGATADVFVVEATTFFDPCRSWFRRTASDSATLAHEQLHFDISELHARRLMALYATEIASHTEFLRKHERLYDRIWEQSRRMQQHYDDEVYADRSAQAAWGARIAAELEAMAAYASKTITLPMR